MNKNLFPQKEINNNIISKENSIISISKDSSSNNIIISEDSKHSKLNKKINISKSLDSNESIYNNKYNSIYLSIYIYNSPPIKEWKKVINDFYFTNNLNKKILIIPLLNNSIRIDFPNEKILQSFYSYLCIIKYENSLFKQIIINKDNIIPKLRPLNISRNISLPSLNKRNYENKLNYVLNNKKKHIINNIIKIYKHNKINKIKFNENENEKIINDYYSKQKFIRNGSPYLNDDEKRKIEEIKNKSKFLNNKGFFTSVGKYSMPIKYISNYVQLSPSENPSIHQFRTIDKLKWITKKGFIKC